MKKTRIVKLIAAIAVMAASLPEAQAIVRINNGGNWMGGKTWYKSKSDTTKVDFTDNTYVLFQEQAGMTKTTVEITGEVKPSGIGIDTSYTFAFNSTNAAAKITQQSGVFTVSAGQTLTLTKTGDKNAVLELAGNADDGKLPITQRGNIVVGAGVTFRISNSNSQSEAYAGTVYSTSTITVSGTFALFRSLYLNGYTVQRDIYHVDVNGNWTDGGDYFDGAYDNSYIQFLVLNGGKVNVGADSVLTQDNVDYKLQSDGRAVNNNDKSGGDKTVFYKTSGDNANLSAAWSGSSGALGTVVMTAGTLTVDALVSSVVNATGGTLAFVGGGNVGAVNVNGDITVQGDTTPTGKVYNIAAQKVVTFAEDLQMEGLSIVGEGGAKVTVQNVSGGTVRYALNEQNARLSASEVAMTAQATGDVTVGNQVAAATVENESEGGYTLTLGNGNTAVQHVIASKGNIVFHNMGEQAVSLADMTIGEGKQVGVYEGTVADSASEATVSIVDTLVAKSGTLLADLELQAGSTLNLGGGQMALGSTLTLQEGLILLDDTTLDAIAALQNIGDKHILITNAPGTTLTYEGVSDGDWARTHFDLSRITDADYKVVAGDNVFAIEKVSNVPEPTTGTLSLLALAALAARRRKCN